MTTHDFATLSLLGDSDLTVADGEEDIRGRTVKDKDGTEIGKVDDLLIDKDDRKVRLMRVESGGFLGMGETKVFIPIEAITMITDIDVWIDQSHDHVARESRYEPHLVTEQKYLGDMAY
ncbi:MAG TPA: PRC-barrel domain-containing protein [Chloroflexota bacterium]|nr:PRC-barrel domain-containing protein [Chloroflexota bacterium]